MQLLYFFENLRTPILDGFMSAVTLLGSEVAFLLIALTLFWCVDKRSGYYVLTVGFFGTLLNQFLKLCCRVPRPWVKDPNFTIVESARADATGYSFPSGHSQNAVGTYGAIAQATKRRWLRWVCIALCVLVPVSRMYLGVHTLQDVLVASLTAVILVLVLYPALYRGGERTFPILLGVMLACAVAFVAYVELWPFPADVDPENLAEGTKNAYSLLGALLGMLVVYLADRKHPFSVEAVWWAQILKLALGLAVVMAVRLLLKAPLLALCGGHDVANGLRYCCMVLVAGLLWPLSFPYFARLGRGKECAK